MKKILKIIISPINYFFIGVKAIASNKIAVIVIFSLSIILLNKTYCYKEELDNYKSDNIIEKEQSNTNYYYNNNKLDTKSLKSIAASELISCINEKLDTNNLPENLTNYINELNNLYNSSKNYFSFLYKDIYTDFTVSYNENQPIFTASTIKAPAMIYLYELASKNEINLDEKLTYTLEFYSLGSGVLKDKEPGSEYTVKQLIEYAIHDSDNIAYKMLMNRFKRENLYSFWSNKGTTNIFKYDTVWGYTSSKDASIYMQELYNFYLTDNTYGEELMTYFKNAEWKQITNKDGDFNTANKGGWSDETFHDVAIVFEENLYILIIMSKTETSDYNNLFQKTSALVGNFHDEYWKYKMSKCNNINQY